MNARNIMSGQMLTGLITGGLSGVTSVLISWALLFESSPFYTTSLYPGRARWTWEVLNLPAFIVIVASNTEVAGAVVMTGQWFLIGFLAAWLIRSRRSPSRR